MNADDSDLLTSGRPDAQPWGALERESEPGKWFPMAAEAVPLIPESRWLEYAAASLRPRVWHVANQGRVGSCASESTTGALAIVREVAGLPREVLNAYSLYRQVNNGRDRGSSVDANLLAVQRVGILPESVWPRSNGWQTKPPDDWRTICSKYRGVEVFDVTSRAEFGSCLCAGLPVVFAVDWPGGGGHSICAVATTSNGVLFLNSWGESYGDGGFNEMYWPRIEAGIRKYGAFALRTAVEA